MVAYSDCEDSCFGDAPSNNLCLNHHFTPWSPRKSLPLKSLKRPRHDFVLFWILLVSKQGVLVRVVIPFLTSLAALPSFLPFKLHPIDICKRPSLRQVEMGHPPSHRINACTVVTPWRWLEQLRRVGRILPRDTYMPSPQPNFSPPRAARSSWCFACRLVCRGAGFDSDHSGPELSVYRSWWIAVAAEICAIPEQRFYNHTLDV